MDLIVELKFGDRLDWRVKNGQKYWPIEFWHSWF